MQLRRYRCRQTLIGHGDRRQPILVESASQKISMVSSLNRRRIIQSDISVFDALPFPLCKPETRMRSHFLLGLVFGFQTPLMGVQEKRIHAREKERFYDSFCKQTLVFFYVCQDIVQQTVIFAFRYKHFRSVEAFAPSPIVAFILSVKFPCTFLNCTLSRFQFYTIPSCRYDRRQRLLQYVRGSFFLYPPFRFLFCMFYY